MNKYQEALDIICNACRCNTYNDIPNCECKEKLLLQELVDKATDKSLCLEFYNDTLTSVFCPVCNAYLDIEKVSEYKYCPYCGQAITL